MQCMPWCTCCVFAELDGCMSFKKPYRNVQIPLDCGCQLVGCQVSVSQVMPSQYQSALMASGSVVDCSRRLLLPSPSYGGPAWKPAPFRLWPNFSKNSSFSKSSSTIQSGKLYITACYSAVPTPSEFLNNKVSNDNGFALIPSPLPVVTNGGMLHTQEAAANSELEDVVDRYNLPEVTESYYTLKVKDDVQANSLDPELQGIIANIANVQKQNEILGKRLKDIQELLGNTARSLNAKVQEVKMDAAKLAKLHEIEDRAEDIRRSVLKAKMRIRRSKVPDSEQVLDLDGTKSQQIISNEGHVEDLILEEINGIEAQMQSDWISFPEDEPESVCAQIQVSRVKSKLNTEASSLFQGTEDDESEASVRLTESEECIVAHPGALSCTKTLIKYAPSNKSAIVTMETTVRCDGEACTVTSLEDDDYIALAVQTLAESARELKKMPFATARDPDPVLYEKHANILELLDHGRVVKAKPMEPPSKFGHEGFVVDLQNRQTGEKIKALFKPGIEGNAEGWHRAPIEMVAYKLNLMLGMDYVPPAFYKSGGVDVNYKHYRDGAFVYFVPKTQHLRKVPEANWGVPLPLLLSDTRILDVLLNNSDRHHGHFLFGEHWDDGNMRPILIDHAAGFRKEAVVRMDHENAFKTGAVMCVSARTYLRLQFLERDIVASTFKGLLSAREAKRDDAAEGHDLILLGQPCEGERVPSNRY